MWPFLPLQSFSGLRLTTQMQLAFEVNRTNFRNSFGLMSLVYAPAQGEAIPRIHSVNFQWDVTRQAIKQRLSYVRGQACFHQYRPRLRPLRNKSAHAPTACPSRRVPIPIWTQNRSDEGQLEPRYNPLPRLALRYHHDGRTRAPSQIIHIQTVVLVTVSIDAILETSLPDNRPLQP